MTDNAKQVAAFVQRKLSILSHNADVSKVKAQLAKLRRGVGKPPGSQPELWEITLGELPEALLSRSDRPTFGEIAIHTALTLYAVHQQGKDLSTHNMNRDESTLGVAARKLRDSDQSKADAIRRRFHAVAMADSMEGLSWHLRGFVQLLRASNIPLDYPRLTEDLFWFQFTDKRDGVRLKWGQDFYRTQKSESQESKTTEEVKEIDSNE